MRAYLSTEFSMSFTCTVVVPTAYSPTTQLIRVLATVESRLHNNGCRTTTLTVSISIFHFIDFFLFNSTQHKIRKKERYLINLKMILSERKNV